MKIVRLDVDEDYEEDVDENWGSVQLRLPILEVGLLTLNKRKYVIFRDKEWGISW